MPRLQKKGRNGGFQRKKLQENKLNSVVYLKNTLLRKTTKQRKSKLYRKRIQIKSKN